MFRISLSIMLLIASVSLAHAQSNNVRMYCAYDYLRHCSAYSLSSPNLAKCMANVGVNLSKKCIQALVDDGLITKQEVIARAAKEGIVVRDGPNGLYIDTNAKIGQEIVTVKEPPKETVVAKEVPETKPQKKVSSTFKSGVEKTKKAITKAASSVTKSVKKAASSVKKQYQKVTKSNRDYANRSNIQNQNELRKKYIAERNIAPEGINADFGRYEAREPGFTKPKPYNFKERMESRDIYSSGVNGY